MKLSGLPEWLGYLETQHPSAIDLGLDRVATVAARLGLLSPRGRVVTVAGTNGKGSTCAVLEALAIEAGVSVGLFTSPHLLRYNERIRIDGAAAADAVIVAAFEQIEAARGELSLTYFEFNALAALLVFAAAGCELLILEVGLGGRLDAVNMIDPDVAVITTIDLDHQEWLGDDREQIGREKAGILRQGCAAVVVDPSPPESVKAAVAELGCDTLWLDDISLPALGNTGLRRENVAAAWAAAGLLGLAVSEHRLSPIVSGLSLPGRCQHMRVAGRDIILDVGHNPAAVAHLNSWLDAHVSRPRVGIFAALSDKDIHAMISPCREMVDAWVTVGLPGVARASGLTELTGAVIAAGADPVHACDTIAAAWEDFLRTSDEATLVVFGSFHTVAAFLQLLEDERERA